MDWKRIAGGHIAHTGKGEFHIGEFSSAAVGKGLQLTSTRTKVLDVCGDDGGVVLTAGTSYRPLRARMLLKAVHTGDVSIFGAQGQLKVAEDQSGVTGHIAGLWGYLECSAAAHINAGCGVRGMADLPSGAVIASGGVLSAFMAASNDLGGTHTGKAVAIHVTSPVAGTWDAFAEIAASSGCLQTASTKTTPTGVDAWLTINVGGTAHYVPMYHSMTA
jgi:hypothetical protein